MAFRGRGRGRGYGGGGGGFGYAKQEPFELFPEIELPDRKAIPIDMDLIIKQRKLENFWRTSPYYLGDGDSKKESESLNLEKYSDWGKSKKRSKSCSFYDFLVLRPDNFPRELLGGSRKKQRVKKVRWNPHADLQKLDVLEKLEENYKDGEKREDGEEEEEGEEDAEEEDGGEFSSDGDYGQDGGFDDDEDDYNMPDEGDDEPTY